MPLVFKWLKVMACKFLKSVHFKNSTDHGITRKSNAVAAKVMSLWLMKNRTCSVHFFIRTNILRTIRPKLVIK